MNQGAYRRIRSFVKREGRLTASQQKAITDMWPKFGLKPRAQIDFAALFGNNHPVILEIGFGMGHSLLQMAQDQPQCNFLGIEVYSPGIGAVLSGMHRQGIHNIRLIQDDAVDILHHFIPDASLSKVMIFFPDPWHKKRHHKRRLIKPSFLPLIAHKMNKSADLHIATDWENYAQEVLSLLESSELFKNKSIQGGFMDNSGHRYSTKFERRGVGLGHNVFDLCFKKT